MNCLSSSPDLLPYSPVPIREFGVLVSWIQKQSAASLDITYFSVGKWTC
ncbi:hypothetical protein FDUTEX481_00092 [Tolypothrix sp. PCC 7601]|nr:hypothetical protein FDUTEX481_00092 [Tolypothrix sp. PCC 7601]